MDAGEVLTFAQSDVLLEQGEAVTEVFFPMSGVISIVTLLEDGGSVENAVVGREGFVGVPLALRVAAPRPGGLPGRG